MKNVPEILVVDDDEGMRQTLELIFERQNYRVSTAETGQAALELAQVRFFNVALLDIRLPDMTGTSLLAQLKKIHPDLEVLLVTGYATLESAMQAITAGAAYYFIKPLDMDEVLARIKEILDKQQLILENKQLYEAALRELAERKRAEEALLRSEAKYRTLFEAAGEAIILSKVDGVEFKVADCNASAITMFGGPYEQLVGTDIMDVSPPVQPDGRPSKEVGDEKIQAALQGQPQSFEWRHCRFDGVEFDAEVLLNRVDLGEEEYYLQAIIRDVTERKRAEQERRRLSVVIEQAPESVIITDIDAAILYINPAFEQETGYTRTEVIGQNPRILQSGQHDPVFYEDLWTTLIAGKVWHGRIVNKKKDGTLYTIEATIGPVHNELGQIVNYVSMRRDVTRELQLEEQYMRSQRMEAVGQLTGGIAHDFNNLLTAINGFAELIQYRLLPDDPLQELINNILHSGRRAADLVKQLLAFSRKQIIEPKVLNLNLVVVDMGAMLQRVIGENIQLKMMLSPDLWSVKVDPAQIEQIIANLAVNARDAMPDGGQLTIETGNVVLDSDYVATHLGAQPGEHILLAMSDTGIGISEEVQAHIFEPFFTTKEVGKGTGLGLATVYGIVKQNNGNIWVYSEEGHGSTFKIYLPRSPEPMQPLPRPELEIDLPTGDETILLVEDDAGVRELARRVLEKQGYTLLEAQNGEEALQVVSEHRGSLHLLLTDIIMPGMTGKTLAEQLTQQQADLKVIYMSGYPHNIIANHGALDPDVIFLSKPFTSVTLTRQVREVLDG